MSHYVVEPCIKCRYTECVSVCPVDCFYEGANMLVINPDECIDCGACIPMCPVNAIYPEDEVPERWAAYKELNTTFSKIWPNITKTKGPLFDAEKFKPIKDKRALFEAKPGEGDPPEDDPLLGEEEA